MTQYEQFMLDFYNLSGIDLRQYKRQQMERRITSLMQKLNYSSFSDFFRSVQQDESTLQTLLDKLTINVSEFFRNPERWDDLAGLLDAESGTLRVWSAACSTGEEPFTLAILLEDKLRRPYRILATDVDEKVLAAAGLGIYKDHQVKSLPTGLLDSCFVQEENVYRIREKYKRNIRFSQHNLLADSYPHPFDLIVCRNALIYFTDEGKEYILSNFVKSLRFGGYLFVGSTEQIFSPQRYGLKLVRPFIYQKTE